MSAGFNCTGHHKRLFSHEISTRGGGTKVSMMTRTRSHRSIRLISSVNFQQKAELEEVIRKGPPLEERVKKRERDFMTFSLRPILLGGL